MGGIAIFHYVNSLSFGFDHHVTVARSSKRTRFLSLAGFTQRKLPSSEIIAGHVENYRVLGLLSDCCQCVLTVLEVFIAGKVKEDKV